MPAQQEWQPPTREEILTKVLQIVENHPERLYQEMWLTNAFGAQADGSLNTPIGDIRPMLDKPITWHGDDADPKANACGTRGCTAGLIVMVGSDPQDQFISESGVVADGHILTIQDRAVQLAGLNTSQHAWLFAAGRSREAVKAGLRELIADPDAPIWEIDDEWTDDPDDDERCDCDQGDCDECVENAPQYTVQILDSAGTVRWSHQMRSPGGEDYSDMIVRLGEEL